MSEEIVFYHNPMSRGRMVHWMLEEVGAPYRFELLDMEKNEHKRPAYLAINPMGKVPAIVHTNTMQEPAICIENCSGRVEPPESTKKISEWTRKSATAMAEYDHHI